MCITQNKSTFRNFIFNIFSLFSDYFVNILNCFSEFGDWPGDRVRDPRNYFVGGACSTMSWKDGKR